MKRNAEKKEGKYNVLALDPSLTAFGWAVISGRKIITFGCEKTEPAKQKTRIRKGDDRMQRIAKLVSALIDICNRYEIALIVSELPHGSQSAVAATALGLVSGMVQTFADVKEIPLEWFSEADSKLSLLGKRSATKEETITKVNAHFDVKWTGVKYKDEAVADAISIYFHAEKYSPILKYLK